MQFFDNINETVKEDLLLTIHKNNKISVAAASFSIYAYRELKKQLEDIEAIASEKPTPTSKLCTS